MANGFARGRGLPAAALSALLAVAAICASSAQATLSPYPSTGYPGANNSISAIVVSGNTAYVGGGFTTFGGQPRNRLAAFDLSTGEVLPWDPDVNGNVNTLAISGTDVVAGGSFTTIGGETRNRIAKINGTSGALRGWNPNASSTVYALAVTSSYVIAGGSFTTMSGLNRRYLAKIDASTGSLNSWNPNGASGGGTVYGLAASGSEVTVVGSFTNINGTARNRIARIGVNTGNLSSWDPNADSSVYDPVVSGSDVYVDGNFNTIGGESRYGIAKIDSSGNATSWYPEPSDSISSITTYGTGLLVSGYFTTIGGAARERLALLDSAGNATSWNPRADSSAEAIAISGTTVVIGGYFNRIGYGDDQVAAARLAVFKDAETPANTSQPQITGAAALGGALSCATGSWSAGDANLVSSYSYRWKRSGSAISGATSSTYTVSAADAGATLSCEVTAANFVGSSSATSASVTVDGSSSGATNPVTPVTPVTVEPSAMFSRPVSGSRAKRVKKLQGAIDADAIDVEIAIQKVYYSRSKSRRGARAKARAKRTVRRSCRRLKKNSKRGRRFTNRGSCSTEKLEWLEAEIIRPKVWRLKLKRSLPKGDYKLYVRAYDSAGNVGSTFSADKKSLVRVKARP